MSKVILSIIGMIVITIIGICFFIPILNSVIDDAIDNVDLGVAEKELFSIFPFILFVCIPLITIGNYLFGEFEFVADDEVSYYVEPEFVEKGLRVKDAKQILKIRFAKGEIDSFEYTERMSRL